MFVFLLQSILSALLGIQIFSENFNLSLADFPLFSARIICAMMLHIRIEAEVRQCVDMLEYLSYHYDDFSSVFVPFCIINMQLFAALFTEIINLCLICTQNTAMDAVINFIALGGIAEIDNYYARSLTDTPLKEAFTYLPEIKHTELSFSSLTYKGKLVRSVYKLYKIVYSSVYFYFAPYITTVLTYLVAGTRQRS